MLTLCTPPKRGGRPPLSALARVGERFLTPFFLGLQQKNLLAATSTACVTASKSSVPTLYAVVMLES
jgi:hypothetical protein